MSRIFINNLNSYVSQAIYNELKFDISEEGEKTANENLIFATYVGKDSTENYHQKKPGRLSAGLAIRPFYHIYPLFRPRHGRL